MLHARDLMSAVSGHEALFAALDQFCHKLHKEGMVHPVSIVHQVSGKRAFCAIGPHKKQETVFEMKMRTFEGLNLLVNMEPNGAPDMRILSIEIDDPRFFSETPGCEHFWHTTVNPKVIQDFNNVSALAHKSQVPVVPGLLILEF